MALVVVFGISNKMFEDLQALFLPLSQWMSAGPGVFEVDCFSLGFYYSFILRILLIIN